jgi:hypothetical protein
MTPTSSSPLFEAEARDLTVSSGIPASSRQGRRQRSVAKWATIALRATLEAAVVASFCYWGSTPGRPGGQGRAGP